MMLSKAEDLPVEIWLNIFSYFEGHELIRSFVYLNSFFNYLLRSVYLKLYIRIQLNESNRKLPDLPWSHINFENIYSLIVGRRKTNCLLQFLRWHVKSLKNLSFLSIYIRKSSDYQNIELLISVLEQLPSLNQLRIKYVAQLNPTKDYFMHLLDKIFQNKFNIEKYSLTINGLYKRRIKTNWSINPMIKSFYISEVSINTSLSILSCTPAIQSLEFVLNHLSEPIEHFSFVLHHLRKINLHIYCVSFIQLLTFKTLAPNLESLFIDGYFSNRDENYFNEHMWNQLLKNLKYIQIDLEFTPISNSIKTIVRDYISRLHDKSWFSHYEDKYTLITFIKFKTIIK